MEDNMPIYIDNITIPARDKVASMDWMATLLGVEAGLVAEPFAIVELDGCTLDYVDSGVPQMHRADDIIMYDVPEPIEVRGIDTYKDTWKLFFEHNEAGPDRFSLSDVQIVAADGVAYAHGLLTIGGGDAHCRLTLGLRRIGGKWKVTHEHHSIPIKLG
jgi:ketosteroid isomerase-like protein